MTVPVIGALLLATACGAETDSGGGAVPPVDTIDTTPATAPPTLPPESGTSPPGELRYDPDVAQADLEAARARWAERGWQSYRFAYTPTCFCPRGDIEVEVIGGRVVDSSGSDGMVLSIEGWFDEIEAAIGTAADIRVTYDDWGYPTSLYIDVDERMADEEFGFELVGFAHVPDAVREFLTDEYACGFGFQVATADQTAVFVVDFVEVTDDVGPPPGTYGLADQSASIRFGTDLMANWCDDVIEEGEPEADVVDTWTVVAGTLELTVDDRTATATMQGVVAVTADAVEVPLGDVTITNTMWGFFAG